MIIIIISRSPPWICWIGELFVCLSSDLASSQTEIGLKIIFSSSLFFEKRLIIKKLESIFRNERERWRGEATEKITKISKIKVGRSAMNRNQKNSTRHKILLIFATEKHFNKLIDCNESETLKTYECGDAWLSSEHQNINPKCWNPLRAFSLNRFDDAVLRPWTTFLPSLPAVSQSLMFMKIVNFQLFSLFTFVPEISIFFEELIKSFHHQKKWR